MPMDGVTVTQHICAHAARVMGLLFGLCGKECTKITSCGGCSFFSCDTLLRKTMTTHKCGCSTARDEDRHVTRRGGREEVATFHKLGELLKIKFVDTHPSWFQKVVYAHQHGTLTHLKHRAVYVPSSSSYFVTPSPTLSPKTGWCPVC